MGPATGNLVAQAHSMNGKPRGGWAERAFRDSLRPARGSSSLDRGGLE